MKNNTRDGAPKDTKSGKLNKIRIAIITLSVVLAVLVVRSLFPLLRFREDGAIRTPFPATSSVKTFLRPGKFRSIN